MLTGFLAVDADAGTQAGSKADGYGTLRLLQLPATTLSPDRGRCRTSSTPTTAPNELNIRRQGNASR